MPNRRFGRIATALGLSVCFLAGECDGCDSSARPIIEARMLPIEFSPPTGTVGQELSEPIGVTLMDEGEGDFGIRPIEDEPIEWAVVSGGGTVIGDARTDEEGLAYAVWTLGSVVGQQKISVVTRFTTLILTATAVAGPAATLTASETVLLFDALGESATLSLSAVDAFGNSTAVAGAGWTTLDDAVATVDSGGLATATGNGSTSVVAALGSTADTVLVEVEQAVAAVSVTAADSVVEVWDTTTLTAAASDANGYAVASEIVWSSADPGVASVDDAGVVTGVSAGAVFVRANAASVTDSVRIAVLPLDSFRVSPDTLHLAAVGDTATLRALVVDGDSLVAVEASWQSRDTTVAVAGGPGIVTATGPGDTWIVAQGPVETDSAHVFVGASSGVGIRR